MLVSTNARFLEQDYMLDNKPRSKVILDELRAKLGEGNKILLRAPWLETHQLDRSESVQAVPPDPARSIYRIGVPRPGSTVFNLHLAQIRSVS